MLPYTLLDRSLCSGCLEDVRLKEGFVTTLSLLQECLILHSLSSCLESQSQDRVTGSVRRKDQRSQSLCFLTQSWSWLSAVNFELGPVVRKAFIIRAGPNLVQHAVVFQSAREGEAF